MMFECNQNQWPAVISCMQQQGRKCDCGIGYSSGQQLMKVAAELGDVFSVISMYSL